MKHDGQRIRSADTIFVGNRMRHMLLSISDLLRCIQRCTSISWRSSSRDCKLKIPFFLICPQIVMFDRFLFSFFFASSFLFASPFLSNFLLSNFVFSSYSFFFFHLLLSFPSLLFYSLFSQINRTTRHIKVYTISNQIDRADLRFPKTPLKPPRTYHDVTPSPPLWSSPINPRITRDNVTSVPTRKDGKYLWVILAAVILKYDHL